MVEKLPEGFRFHAEKYIYGIMGSTKSLPELKVYGIRCFLREGPDGDEYLFRSDDMKGVDKKYASGAELYEAIRRVYGNPDSTDFMERISDLKEYPAPKNVDGIVEPERVEVPARSIR